jgi:hypothetical protein
MTLQVAFVGLDGILIASDTKGASDGPIRRITQARKILVSGDNAFICAFAGESRSLAVAQELAYDFPPTFHGDQDLWQYLNKRPVLTELAVADPAPSMEFLIAFQDGQKVWQLWGISFQKRLVVPRRIETRDVCGDHTTSAVFLSDIYYRKDSIDRLKLLAAHVVLGGHEMNSAYIEGLDILIAKHGRPPVFIEPDELKTLKESSARVRGEIGKLFFPEN